MYLSTSVSVAHLSPLTLGTSLALQYLLLFSKCKTSQFYPYITFTSLVNGHLFRLDPLSKLPVQRNIRFSLIIFSYPFFIAVYFLSSLFSLIFLWCVFLSLSLFIFPCPFQKIIGLFLLSLCSVRGNKALI